MQTIYFQCFKKDKAVQFQHKHSNLLPHRQLPPSPRVAGSAVTSFPAKTLNCHISRTRHTRIPLFARNWGLVTSMLYTKKSRYFIHGNCAYLARICASLLRPRPRGEEGNCTYLLPLSHRALANRSAFGRILPRECCPERNPVVPVSLDPCLIYDTSLNVIFLVFGLRSIKRDLLTCSFYNIDMSCTASLCVCDYLIISMIYCDGAGSWNNSLWKTGIRLSCMVSTIATDIIWMATLTTQGAKTSAATQRAHDAKITSLWHQNVILTSNWRY